LDILSKNNNSKTDNINIASGKFYKFSVDISGYREKYTYTQPIYFDIFSKRIFTANWSDLYIKVCNILFEKNEELAYSLLKTSLLKKTKRIYFSKNINDFRDPKILDIGFFAETNFSAKDIILNIGRLLKKFSLDFEAINITYIEKEKHKKIAVKTTKGESKKNKITKNGTFTIDFSNYKQDFSFMKPTYFEIFSRKILTNSWIDLYIKLCNTLVENDKQTAYSLLKTPLSPSSTIIFFSENKNGFIKPESLKNGFYTETSLSINILLSNIKKLLAKFSINHEEILICYAKKDQTQTENNQISNPESQNDSKNEFKDWMENTGFSKSTAVNYASAINLISEFAEQKGYINRSLYMEDNKEKIEAAINKLLKDNEFVNLDNCKKRRFTLSLQRFTDFLNLNINYSNLKNSNNILNKTVKISSGENNFLTIDFSDDKCDYAYTKPIFFELFSKKITTGNWSDLYVKLCNVLFEININIADDLLETPLSNRMKSILFSKVPGNFNDPKLLNNGTYAETNFSAKIIVSNIQKLLTRFSIEPNEISINYVKKNDLKRSAEKLFNNSPQDNTKNKFKLWMLNKGFSESTAVNYASAINLVSNFAEEKDYMDKNFYIESDQQRIRIAITLLEQDDNFNRYNIDLNRRLSVALKSFVQFLNNRNETKTHQMLVNKDYSKYEKILSEHFHNGYKTGLAIHFKKFKEHYKQTFNQEITIEQETLNSILTHIGFQYDQNKITSLNNVIEESVLKEITDFANKAFISGKTIFYYESLFERFKDLFLETRSLVHEPDILKRVLEHHYPKKYYFSKSYFSNTSDKNGIKDEIKGFLIKKNVPMTYDEIEKEVYNIPIERIKTVFAQNIEFVSNGHNVRTHIDCIDITKEELIIIKKWIRQSIDKQKYATVHEIEELLKKKTDFFERNQYLNRIGLGNMIDNYFSDEFNCSSRIFCENGYELNYIKIIRRYCESKKSITINELNDYAQKLGLANLRTLYLEDVFKDYANVSQKKLVKKQDLYFEVDSVDEAIAKFCTGDYIPIKKINTFSLFPSSNYPWNSFLLKTYLENFSKIYMFLTSSTAFSKCIGAVLKKKSNLKNYNDLLSDVLSKIKDEVISEERALNYLYKEGYLAKRRNGDIDTIIQIAKNIRRTRGMK
jgi:hypothetical protein